MATITGTSGDDNLPGSSGDDIFLLNQGGEDSATGLGGNDIFKMGGAFDAGDSLDGGIGFNQIFLRGDYSAGVTFTATTLTNVGRIALGDGFDYTLTTDDATVAAGATMTVDASALAGGHALNFDGHAETDGHFHFIDGAGNDVLKGGSAGDAYTLLGGGEDSVTGGSGNDVFVVGGTLDAGDSIDGGLSFGAARDVLRLAGDYSAGLTLGPDTIQNIYTLQFGAGHDYKITVDNNNFVSGPTVLVRADALGAGNFLNFDGSASDANFHFLGGAGNDVLTGGTAADLFDLSQGGNDTASGGDLADRFVMGATLTAADRIDGGAGNDLVSLTGMGAQSSITFSATTMVSVESLELAAGHSYKLITNDATVAAGATLTVDGQRIDSIDALNFDGSAETDGHFILRGGAGDDLLTGGAQSDTFNLTVGGHDTAHGGAGDDIFNMGATLEAADKIDGGADNDTVTLNGDYSGGVVFGAATMTGIETLDLAGGHSYNLKPNNANVAHGATLTVDASALGASDSLTFDASPLDFLTLDVTAGAGDDVITGAFSATITLDLSHGGNDTVHSESGGITTFLMGAALTANDKLDGGGSGSIELDGDYTGAHAVIFNATTITNMQNFTVDGGHSYDLTADAATLGTHQLRVFATGLLAGDTLTFDGSATVTGVYQFNAGAGSYSLTGGSLNDQFNMGASFTASDHVDGGAAGDDALDLNGDYSAGLVFGATTMVNIANLQLSGGHSYNLTTNDATVASGAGLTVDATALGAGNTMTFNASAETNGGFAITGGAGDDSITLGNASVLAGSTIDGGAGNDTLIVNGDYSAGVTFTATTLLNVENLVLSGGHDYKFTTNDATVASGGSITVNMVALGTSHTLTLDASAETDGAVVVTAGAAFTAADSFIVGTGQSALILNGDYSAGLTFGATTAVNIGDIEMGGGHSYNLTLNDATAAAGMAVDATALGAGDTLTVNASAETNVSLNIFGGAGNDTITGGQNGDVINIDQGGIDTVHGGSGGNEIDVGGSLTAADSIDGGGGGGTYIAMNGDYSGANALVLGATTVTGVGEFQLGAGNSYDITTNDATVASGLTFNIDATSLGAGDSLIFNGSAETDGSFDIVNGSGDDTVIGSNGADTFTGGAGADTYKYTAVAQSTGVAHDSIADYAAGTDVFNFGGIVGGFDGTLSGSVSDATFDTDIGNAFSDSVTLHGNHAWVVVATGGDLVGHSFVVVDTNNNAHYDGGTDYVIDITGFTGTITAGDFI